MSMTVGALRKALGALDPTLDVMLAVNGTFVPILGLTAVPGSSFVVARGKGKTQQSRRFTIHEDGVLGHLAHLGVSDDAIAAVLGRPSQAVQKRRKALGFAVDDV